MFRHFLEYVRFKVWAPWHINHYHSYYTSHSQFGEDMVLRYIFKDKAQGFYVDIGAHHPVFISNTYHFYQKGWRGLCVDASVESIAAFHLIRPRDISIVACLSPTSGDNITFYRFDQAALSTTNGDEADQIVQSGRAKLLNKSVVKTSTLDEILTKNLPRNTDVDFITIDIEGVDEALILAHDWNKFRPKGIVFESESRESSAIEDSACFGHLRDAGYRIEAKCGRSVVMIR